MALSVNTSPAAGFEEPAKKKRRCEEEHVGDLLMSVQSSDEDIISEQLDDNKVMSSQVMVLNPHNDEVMTMLEPSLSDRQSNALQKETALKTKLPAIAFRCFSCRGNFPSFNKLREHFLCSHMFEQEAPVQNRCKVCRKRFRNPVDLAQHCLLKHQYKCNICGTKFIEKANYNFHKETAHKSEKQSHKTNPSPLTAHKSERQSHKPNPSPLTAHKSERQSHKTNPSPPTAHKSERQSHKPNPSPPTAHKSERQSHKPNPSPPKTCQNNSSESEKSVDVREKLTAFLEPESQGKKQELAVSDVNLMATETVKTDESTTKALMEENPKVIQASSQHAMRRELRKEPLAVKPVLANRSATRFPRSSNECTPQGSISLVTTPPPSLSTQPLDVSSTATSLILRLQSLVDESSPREGINLLSIPEVKPALSQSSVCMLKLRDTLPSDLSSNPVSSTTKHTRPSSSCKGRSQRNIFLLPKPVTPPSPVAVIQGTQNQYELGLNCAKFLEKIKYDHPKETAYGFQSENFVGVKEELPAFPQPDNQRKKQELAISDVDLTLPKNESTTKAILEENLQTSEANNNQAMGSKLGGDTSVVEPVLATCVITRHPGSSDGGTPQVSISLVSRPQSTAKPTSVKPAVSLLKGKTPLDVSSSEIKSDRSSKAMFRDRTLSPLSETKETETQTLLFSCETCGMPFEKLENLKYHRLLAHQMKCDVCRMTFIKKDNYDYHKQTAHRNKRTKYKCEVCGEEFKTYHRLYNHLSHHEELQRFLCDICGKGFAFEGRLTAHLAYHNRGLRQCDTCGKVFRNIENFKKHLRKHAGFGKLFQCEVCGKRLSTKDSHTAHMLVHKGPPQFKCDMCDKAYYSNFNLKNHIKDKHKTKEEQSAG